MNHEKQVYFDAIQVVIKAVQEQWRNAEIQTLSWQSTYKLELTITNLLCQIPVKNDRKTLFESKDSYKQCSDKVQSYTIYIVYYGTGIILYK